MSEKEKKEKCEWNIRDFWKNSWLQWNCFFIVHQQLIKENQNQRLRKVLHKG